MFTNRNLLIIALIAIVNAIGYGIIIPIMFDYSRHYGLSVFQNGLLFAVFSLCQFFATPLIGRMSDKYGRRPLLIGSISGTAISFLMMAFAPNALILFVARALDGLTAGNVPVASAVISDTTTPQERAKGFGIIGASFGLGFILGPAISGFTYELWRPLPFLIAAVISTIAVILTTIFLPETNQHMGEVKKGKLFDFSHLVHALFDKNIGPTLVIVLLYFSAFFMYITAFQPFGQTTLRMTARDTSMLFTMFGVLNLIAQVVLVQRFSKQFGVKKAVSIAILVVSTAFLFMYFSNNVPLYVVISIVLGLFNAMVQPLIQTMLSQEVDEASQGSIMGIHASYMSIGQILGPIIGGLLAEIALNIPFIAASSVIFICFLISLKVKISSHKESAF